MRLIIISTFILTLYTSCSRGMSNYQIFESILSQSKTPKLFMPGNVTKRNIRHFGSSFSKYGEHVVFTMNERNKPFHVFIQYFENGVYSKPESVTNDTIYSYADASISEDGRTISLISNRPHDSKPDSKRNGIWQFHKTNNTWGDPKYIDITFDDNGGFGYPTMTRDKTLYFAYMPADGLRNMDIYYSKFNNGKYALPNKLPEIINSSKFEGDPYIDKNERFLIFAGFERDENYGKSDLYISFNQNDIWTKPINLGIDINSHGFDGSPYITSDDKYIIFTSSRHPDIENEEEYFNIFYASFDLDKYKKFSGIK